MIFGLKNLYLRGQYLWKNQVNFMKRIEMPGPVPSYLFPSYSLLFSYFLYPSYSLLFKGKVCV